MPHLFSNFSRREVRNIGIYILGIMMYKFALEYYNGAFITLANERFGNSRYKKIGILTGLNSAMQCVGSILVAPLIKRFPTRSVLSAAALIFGCISAILLICDAATGGKPKSLNGGKQKYGTWDPNGLFPIYIISGISYGTIELIRRVIPRDIVGGDVGKLRRMDAIVHVMYEVAGTTGAFTSTALIGKLGYNYSSLASPILFSCGALVWAFISDVQREDKDGNKTETDLQRMDREDTNKAQSYGRAVLSGFSAFGRSCYKGAMIIFSDRKYIWLVPGYSFALYGHRYLENGLAPIFAKQVIGTSSYSQIIVGGSNFGELLGAMSVLFLTNRVPTPLPWLRLDALMLNIVWVLPFINVTPKKVASAWKLAGIFIPVSYGWAAGDVSLAAYIQSTLSKLEDEDKDVSALGSVMAFLYVTYIVLYAVLSSVLGSWVDKQLANGTKAGIPAITTARNCMKYIGGTQFTILSVIVIAATFIPKGGFAFNPKLIEDQKPEDDSATYEGPEVGYKARKGSDDGSNEAGYDSNVNPMEKLGGTDTEFTQAGNAQKMVNHKSEL